MLCMLRSSASRSLQHCLLRLASTKLLRLKLLCTRLKPCGAVAFSLLCDSAAGEAIA